MTNYLTRYDPFGEMLSLRSAMDRMFQNVYGSGGDQETFAALETDLARALGLPSTVLELSRANRCPGSVPDVAQSGAAPRFAPPQDAPATADGAAPYKQRVR